MKPYLISLIFVGFAFADAIKTDTEVILTIKGVPNVDSQDFNDSYTVYSTGKINLPLIGDVKAAGKTPDGLAHHIEQIYKSSKIYTNPTVNVTYSVDNTQDVKTFTFRSQQGSKVIPYQRDMTLQEAIASAGGAGTFDSKRRALLERNSKEYEYDMTLINHRNLKIYPKDVIKLPHINKDSGILRRLFGKN